MTRKQQNLRMQPKQNKAYMMMMSWRGIYFLITGRLLGEPAYYPLIPSQGTVM